MICRCNIDGVIECLACQVNSPKDMTGSFVVVGLLSLPHITGMPVMSAARYVVMVNVELGFTIQSFQSNDHYPVAHHLFVKLKNR
jgi:hypothetical protein